MTGSRKWSRVLTNQFRKAEALATDALRAKTAIQGELDDLLMVLGDTEEKLSRYRERLVELGEEVSDDDDDEESSNDDEDDYSQEGSDILERRDERK